MKKLLFLFLVGGCMSGATTGTQQGTVMSCFQGSKTGALDCIDTPEGPETQAQDVDDDGKADTFVCADRDHDEDGVPDFEDGDDHGGSGSGSGSGSSADDGSGSGSGSGTSDGSGTSGDHDGDGIDDDEDCGNVTPPPPPPPPV
jgi:hypothetical protein